MGCQGSLRAARPESVTLFYRLILTPLYNAPDNKESDNKVKPQVIKLNEALDALERLKLYKGQ